MQAFRTVSEAGGSSRTLTREKKSRPVNSGVGRRTWQRHSFRTKKIKGRDPIRAGVWEGQQWPVKLVCLSSQSLCWQNEPQITWTSDRTVGIPLLYFGGLRPESGSWEWWWSSALHANARRSSYAELIRITLGPPWKNSQAFSICLRFFLGIGLKQFIICSDNVYFSTSDSLAHLPQILYLKPCGKQKSHRAGRAGEEML